MFSYGVRILCSPFSLSLARSSSPHNMKTFLSTHIQRQKTFEYFILVKPTNLSSWSCIPDIFFYIPARLLHPPFYPSFPKHRRDSSLFCTYILSIINFEKWKLVEYYKKLSLEWTSLPISLHWLRRIRLQRALPEVPVGTTRLCWVKIQHRTRMTAAMVSWCF